MAGSLTQTSMLHCRKGFPLSDRVAASMAVVQSTSPHYWFLASLDSARQQLALEGPELIGRALDLARSVRDAINAIPGLTVFGRDIIDGQVVSGFDETKITIDFSGGGLDGVTAERLLPGIPVLTLGEEITAACQAYIRRKMAGGYKPNGPADGTLATIRVLKEDFHER